LAADLNRGHLERVLRVFVASTAEVAPGGLIHEYDLRHENRIYAPHTLLPLCVRGLDRVRLHADLTILAKLASALARARTVPLAA
jgi:hypothetical protein